MKTINAVLQLRRDNDYNFNKIKDTFIPANGEVVLVDTAKDGLRAKVGNGYSTYAELNFTDADLRNAVLHGYLKDNVFYYDNTYSTPMAAMINKIYIDDSVYKIYYFDGTEYKNIQTTFSTATDITPGLVKLYNVKGQNIDGTITQKLFTDEIDKKYEMDIKIDEELLIFK